MIKNICWHFSDSLILDCIYKAVVVATVCSGKSKTCLNKKTSELVFTVPIRGSTC